MKIPFLNRINIRMDDFSIWRKESTRLILLFLVFFLARAAFMLFMPFVFSVDMHAWVKVYQVLEKGENPYQVTTILNWPPFWMQIIFLCGKLATYFEVPMERIFQLLLIGGEALFLLVSYIIFRRFTESKRAFRILLFTIALNPVCIFLTCQHGNFDVFVGLCILLFMLSMMQFSRSWQVGDWLLACFFLGLGILTKTVPLVLAPLLLNGINGIPKKYIVSGFLILFLPVTLGMSVIYTLAPSGVTDHVLNYRSVSGWFGITGLFLNFEREDLRNVYAQISPFIFLAIMIVISFNSLKSRYLNEKKLVRVILTILVFIPAFGPGYSPPYIFWFLAPMIFYYSFCSKPLKRFIIAGLIILALVFTYEYAFYFAHGAFASMIDTTESMQEWCRWAGKREIQVWNRFPVFLFYSGLFILLLFTKEKAGLVQNR
jgi:hypothetical protein